jgi:hypothetical protein
MSGVVSLIAIITWINARIVIEEGLIPASVEAFGAIGGAGALQASVIAGGTQILDLIVDCTVDEESGIIHVASLRASRVAKIVHGVAIVAIGSVTDIAHDAVGGRSAVGTADLALRCEDDHIRNLDVAKRTTSAICCDGTPRPARISCSCTRCRCGATIISP